MRVNSLLVRISFAALALLCTRTSYADCPQSPHYVATTGADSNPGTMEAPWKTINYAISKTGADDCVYVRAGEYEEGGEIWIRETQGGAEGKWWTLQAYPGERVLLKTRVLLEGPYTRIRGFEMASGAPIISRGSKDHKEILNNKFSGAYTYAPISVGTNDVLVEGNVIDLDGSGSTQDHGIYVLYGARKVIRNNVIRKPPGYGIHIYDENKYPFSPNIRAVTVEGNLIVGAVQRAGIIIATGPSVLISDVVVRRNLLVRNKTGGVVIGTSGVSNVKIQNNTLFENEGKGIDSGGAAGIGAENNIVWGAGTALAGAFATLGPNLFGPGNPPGSNMDSKAIFADPKFVAPAMEDFHLADGSPAIDRGADIGLMFAGAAPDLGAYEVGLNTGPGGDAGFPPSLGSDAGSGGATGVRGNDNSANSANDGCGCHQANAGGALGFFVLAAVNALLRRKRRA